MKRFFLMIVSTLICGVVFISCNRQTVTIFIGIQDQPEVDMLIYSVPISGTIYLGFADTLKQSETGKFELKLKIAQPSFITIWDAGFQNRVKLLVEPGNNYYVSMMPQKNMQITGANEKGQMLYATLPDPSFVEFC